MIDFKKRRMDQVSAGLQEHPSRLISLEAHLHDPSLVPFAGVRSFGGVDHSPMMIPVPALVAS